MSLLSAIILPHLEKELLALEPELAEFLLKGVKSIGSDLMIWIEHQINEHNNAKKENLHK